MKADQEVHAELEVDPPAHLSRFEQERLILDFDGRGPRGAVPTNRERYADVFLCLERGDGRPVGVAERRGFGANRLDFGSHDRVWGSDELRSRDVVLHHEPLENPAELGVPLFVATQVGCEVVERPHGSADVGKGESRQQLAIWDFFRRKRDGYCQDARPNPGLSGSDPERRATADGVELRLGDGNEI